MASSRNIGNVLGLFLRLGLVSFGGPVAHLGYFHAEFVRRRRWIGESEYADLVALCQFLPGPSSSQVAFALGMRRAGLGGAVAASVGFLLPSAAAMIAVGYGIAGTANLGNAGWIHGLKLAAVGVVAQAVLSMGRRLCPDVQRVAIAIGAAGAVLCFPGAWAQVAVIAAAALIGGVLLRSTGCEVSRAGPEWAGKRRSALTAFVLFVVLMVAPAVIARTTGSQDAAVFDGFFRSGALVFGGGHVVLPLLREEVVPRGWVSDDVFLAGYGAAQAMPGPLFSFAGFLGTAIYRGPAAWLGGVMCLAAIFLPGWLLIWGALPFWYRLQGEARIRKGMQASSAAVVGILLAALYQPLCTQSIGTPADAAVAAAALVLLLGGAPPVVVVLLCAAGGQWLLR